MGTARVADVVMLGGYRQGTQPRAIVIEPKPGPRPVQNAMFGFKGYRRARHPAAESPWYMGRFALVLEDAR